MDYSSNKLLNKQKKPKLEHKRKSHKRRHTVHRAYKKSAEVAKQTFAKHCNVNPNLLYQGAIHGGGMDPGMDSDYSTNQLLNVLFFYWPLGGGAPRAATQYLSRLRQDSHTKVVQYLSCD